MIRRLAAGGIALAVLALASAGALASGKKEGGASEGAVAPIASTATGDREKTLVPEGMGDPVGWVSLSATMMAGAGAGKCRMNFVLFNNSAATVAVGLLGSAVSSKGEILDNWVINVGALAPSSQTARLFSCGVGAAQLTLSPLPEFGSPPLKCVNAAQELESCAVGLKVRSSLPMIERDQIKLDPSVAAAAAEKKH